MRKINVKNHTIFNGIYVVFVIFTYCFFTVYSIWRYVFRSALNELHECELQYCSQCVAHSEQKVISIEKRLNSIHNVHFFKISNIMELIILWN